MPISETDLILNKDGSVYHLNLLPKNISDRIITVGDPSRVYRVSEHFDDAEFEMNKREFITHVGSYKGKRITVMSTGIGTDNVEIFMTELDALVNVDLKTREVKPRKKKLRIVRVGTSGSLQEDIPVGTQLVSEYAVGLDATMSYYNLPQTEYEKDVAEALMESVKLPSTPYVVQGSESLRKQIGYDMVAGNTITTSGFYSPQGRKVRIPTRFGSLLDELNYFHFESGNFWLTNFEMETAALYALGRLMGHEMLSVNAIIANRMKRKFIKDANKVIDELILKVLDRI